MRRFHFFKSFDRSLFQTVGSQKQPQQVFNSVDDSLYILTELTSPITDENSNIIEMDV